MLMTILGIVLGFAVGIGLRFVDLSEDAKMWLGKCSHVRIPFFM